MVDRAVTYDINAKDNASDVFDRVAENLTRSLGGVGKTGDRISGLSDQLERMRELFQQGPAPVKAFGGAVGEMGGQILGAGEKAATAVGTFQKLLEVLKSGKTLLGSAGAMVVGGTVIAAGALTKAIIDVKTHDIDLKTREIGLAPTSAVVAEGKRKAFQDWVDKKTSNEDWFDAEIARANANFNDSTSADVKGLADLNRRAGQIGMGAGDRAADDAKRAGLSPTAIEDARKAGTALDEADKKTKSIADNAARMARSFAEAETKAQGIQDASKTGAEHFKDQVEEIRRLGQLDLLDFPAQEKAIDDLKRKLGEAFQSPQQRLGAANKNIDELAASGAITAEQANRGKLQAKQSILGSEQGGSNNLQSRFLTRAPGTDPTSILKDSLAEQKKTNAILSKPQPAGAQVQHGAW